MQCQELFSGAGESNSTKNGKDLTDSATKLDASSQLKAALKDAPQVRLPRCPIWTRLRVVRLARFERATFGSGDRRSSPAELQAHALIIFDLRSESNP